MRLLLLLTLFFGLACGFENQATGSEVVRQKSADTIDRSDLEVSLVADKRTYKPGDRIRLEIKITNTNAIKDIFVYGTLQFGLRAGLRLFRRDSKGKEVPTRFIDTGSELPPKPGDIAAFVKLRPFHFLGKPYNSTIYLLNLEKPGRYKMWVEYHSPLSSSQVDVKPFFGEEMGPIKSNDIWITVVP